MIQRVTTDSPLHKYFTMMLNMAEDDLDPFQFRLLAHYIRWTGHGGKHEESLRTTAQKIKMSVNTIQRTLDQLADMGYLLVKRPEKADARRGKMIEVTVVDRWTENIVRYAKSDEKQVENNAVSNMIQPPAQPVSDLTQTPVSNLTRLEEQNTEERKNHSAVSGATPAVLINPMKEAIVTAFGWKWETMTRSEKGTVQTTAKQLCETKWDVEDVPALYAECKKRGWSNFSPAALLKVVSDVRKKQTNILQLEPVAVEEWSVDTFLRTGKDSA